VLRGLSSYRGQGSLESWADRVVARVTFAWLRRRRPRRAFSLEIEDEGMADEVATPDEYLRRRRLVTLLDQLPHEQRYALVLHHVLGLSVSEIALETAAKAETVRTRLRLGKHRLRALADPDSTRAEPTDGQPEPFVKRRDFPGLDAGPGPARPLSPADVDWFVEQVVGRALEPARKPRSRFLSVRSLSLAALAVVTSAAAATVVHQVRKSAASSEVDVRWPQRPTQEQRRAPAQPTSQAIAESVPSSDIAAPPRAAAPPSTNPPSLVSNETTAADELSAANELRHKAQWQAAEAAYGAVAARYAGAQEGYVAQLAAAELRLAHLGDPAGALRLFQSLPRGNPLGVEAQFGIGRAYRALGDRAAETAALRALIDAYPTSLQADGARERLKQLAVPSRAP
jgi:RNA polymerase sigma-70 factor (ECF subfamily)